MKYKKRGLSKNFMHSLKKGGLFHPLLLYVRKDPTLCLEIRQNYINIYYRGGNLIKIEEKGCYIASFDKNYGISENKIPRKELCDESDVEKWVTAIPSLKQAMDFWFGAHPKEEREFQQLVLRENNGCIIGNSTDYFIIDIEYDNHKGARFDLVAVEWKSESSARKLQGGNTPKLCFIEMKYGDGALKGKSGILSHIQDFKAYIEDNGLRTIKEEMATVFKQKRELGLIPALHKNRNIINEFSDEVDLLFLVANHDPASGKLEEILNQIAEKYKNEKMEFNIKFCCSNFLGYGIYEQNVFLCSDFISNFKKQISCKL
jgi:hypothetical protein